jgi:hypothetical protein
MFEIEQAANRLVESIDRAKLDDDDKVIFRCAVTLVRRALIDLNRLADAAELIARKLSE